VRGRKPKPTRAKVIAGTLRPGRMNRDEPAPKRGRPVCPAWLPRPAKTKWKALVPELDRLGLLTVIDGDALACFCVAWAEHQWATKALAKDGHTITSERGVVKPHPAVAMQRTAWAAIRQFAALYGLDPSSRVRLKVPPKEETDPMSAFLDQTG